MLARLVAPTLFALVAVGYGALAGLGATERGVVPVGAARGAAAALVDMDGTLVERVPYDKSAFQALLLAHAADRGNATLAGALDGFFERWNAATLCARPLPRVIRIARRLHARGLALYLITNRGARCEPFTRRRLTELGLDGIFVEVVHRAPNSTIDVAEHKRAAMRDIERRHGVRFLFGLEDENHELMRAEGLVLVDANAFAGRDAEPGAPSDSDACAGGGPLFKRLAAEQEAREAAAARVDEDPNWRSADDSVRVQQLGWARVRDADGRWTARRAVDAKTKALNPRPLWYDVPGLAEHYMLWWDEPDPPSGAEVEVFVASVLARRSSAPVQQWSVVTPWHDPKHMRETLGIWQTLIHVSTGA